MLITPPDVISQTLLAVPMWLLFEVGLIGSRFLGQPKSKTDEDLDDLGQPKSKTDEDLDDDPVEPSELPAVAAITNEATENEPKDGEIDEFDLHATAETDEIDSPIIEELDKPEPPDGGDSVAGPPKPPST